MMMMWTGPCYCLDMQEVASVDLILPLDEQNHLQSLKEDVHQSWVDIVDSNASVEWEGKMVVVGYEKGEWPQTGKTCC